MEGGWIKLYRKLVDSDMYKDLNSVQRDMMINILMSVNHKENQWMYKGKLYAAKPGQMVTSLESLRLMCAKGTSIQNVRTAIDRLITWRFLTNESTKTGRLLTVINWGLYQYGSDETNKETNSDLTKTSQLTRMIKNDKEKKIDQSSASASDRPLYSEEFETFWKVYPRKIGKQRAYSLWNRRVNYFKPELRADTEELLKAAENYRDYCDQNVSDKKFIKHASTFLSDKQDYLDYLNPKSEEEKPVDKLTKDIHRIELEEWINHGGDPLDTEEFNAWVKRGADIRELRSTSRKSTDRFSAD